MCIQLLVCFIYCAIWMFFLCSKYFYILLCYSLYTPLPSNRHHRSNGDCLEGKGENYQVCSVQYCVQQLCTLQCTHMNRPNSSLDWVFLTGPISLCLDSFLYMYYCMHM